MLDPSGGSTVDGLGLKAERGLEEPQGLVGVLVAKACVRSHDPIMATSAQPVLEKSASLQTKCIAARTPPGARCHRRLPCRRMIVWIKSTGVRRSDDADSAKEPLPGYRGARMNGCEAA